MPWPVVGTGGGVPVAIAVAMALTWVVVSARKLAVFIALTLVMAADICAAVRPALVPGAAPWQLEQLLVYSARPSVPVGGGGVVAIAVAMALT